MSGCCQGFDDVFGARAVARDLARYRRRGPTRPTRRLLAELRERGVAGATVLDIGGGIGAVQQGLLDAGAERATSVEASGAFLRAAREEAERLGRGERISYRQGDYVVLAAALEPADVVTLDRVICCYGDVEALVGRSADHARRLYGLVHPREAWWTRLGVGVANLVCRMSGRRFRAFVHPLSIVDATAGARGLELRSRTGVGPVWQVSLYERASAT